MPLYRMERSRPGRPAVRDFDLAPLGREAEPMSVFEGEHRVTAAVPVHDPAFAGRDGREQAAEDALQQDAFARGQPLPERGPDTEGDELDGAIQRDGQAVALDEAAREHAGERVPRAGVVGGDICAIDAPKAVLVAFVGNDRSILSGVPAAFQQWDACGDHGLRSHCGQAAQPTLDFLGRDPGRERLVEEQGYFGDVRGDDVGAGDDPAHFFHHFRSHGGIKDAVVPKHRVHDRQPAGGEAVADAPGHRIHLFRGGHEAGVYAVEMEAEPFPVVEDAAQFRGEVAQRIVREFHRVRGEHRRGHRADLYAHAGEDRDRHRQRRAPETRHIVDRGDSGDWIAHSETLGEMDPRKGCHCLSKNSILRHHRNIYSIKIFIMFKLNIING